MSFTLEEHRLEVQIQSEDGISDHDKNTLSILFTNLSREKIFVGLKISKEICNQFNGQLYFDRVSGCFKFSMFTEEIESVDMNISLEDDSINHQCLSLDDRQSHLQLMKKGVKIYDSSDSGRESYLKI